MSGKNHKIHTQLCKSLTYIIRTHSAGGGIRRKRICPVKIARSNRRVYRAHAAIQPAPRVYKARPLALMHEAVYIYICSIQV